MKTREEKAKIVKDITEKLENYNHFYLADISGLDASETTELRFACYKQDIKLIVVKNTLLKQALEQANFDYEELQDTLTGPMSVMFTETGNAPGKLIKTFRKKYEKPVIKAACIEGEVYKGDQVETLANLKSREELIADIVLTLKSPLNNVMSALNSGSNILTGVLETLSEKNE